MTVIRSLPVSVLLAVAACASNPQPGQAPRPARGEDGPPATISATYTGGIIAREVTASFNVSQPAFVVVGHLGGDGVLRVLYPTIPNRFDVTLPARRGYRTEPFFAGYDGAPSLHSFTLAPYRNAGARFDSYDGRGYGYVFILASRNPMRLDAFSDGFDWVDLDVQDYFRTSDPRVAIREFAERLAGGRGYTLKFARSYSTQNYSGYAAMAFDCAALSSVGVRYLEGFWGLYGASWSAFGLRGHDFSAYSNDYYRGCGGRHYAGLNYNRYGWGPAFNPYSPYPPGVGTPPIGPITPVLTRPTERRFGDRATTLAQSALERQASGTPRNARNVQNLVRTRNASRSNDNGGSQISHRDLNRGTSDAPSSWGAGRTYDRTHTVNSGSSGGGSFGGGTVTRSPSPPPPPPQPAPTTAVPGSQGATTKVKQ